MKIFKKLAKLFKSLLKAIKKILAILLIVIAVILFVWATICTAGATLAIAGFLITPMTAVLLGVLAVTGAFLIDKDTTKEITGKIGDALGSVAETVGSVTGKVVGGGVKGLLSSPVVWLVGGFGLLWMLSGDSGNKPDKPKKATKAAPVRSAQMQKGLATPGVSRGQVAIERAPTRSDSRNDMSLLVG